MAKNKFDFKSVEKKWREFWEREKIFKTDSKKKISYSIDTPPPTVSGKMHLGHSFSYSQQDFIARFMRMRAAREGGTIFYPFGTDDNGLPTERLVERINKVKSKDMSRAEFIKLCLKTLKEITPEFIQDWKDIGMSCDFSKTYSTIDDNSRKLSQKSFIDLYKEGNVYKKEFPTIWCPDCQTSIAQAELEDKEEKSLFSTLKFHVPELKKDLLIATTRPEMLEACVAVFVHPEDKKYAKFVGKKAKVPLFGQEVLIIEDKSANPEKGTGALMICSYGDRFDVDAIQRHNLAPKQILNKQGRIIEGKYSGLKVKEARKKIIEDLKEKNLIADQKDVTHVVNVHDKCGTPIEFIATEQWFIKILDNKKKWIELGKKINWYPEFMKKRYDNWVQGLEWDWNISRERHFGIPIPVWECKSCREIVLPDESELPIDPLQTKKACPKCGKDTIPENKVLDTWATSSLSPQIASSLFGNKIKIPYSLRPNAHDIIRTWAFYTIVKSYLHEGKIPWNDIIVSGVVSLGGEKMSKSKGNVIEPRDVLEKYGADALRFWAAGSKLGNDLDYQEKDLLSGTKMVNKLLNASKFVFMNLKNYDPKKTKLKSLETTDELFLGQLKKLIISATKNFENYEYSRVKADAEQFFWNDFCDNYLEIVKKRVYQDPEGSPSKISAQYTLYNSLLAILKIIAPIIPYITEEIYQEFFRKTEKEKSIHVSSWPEHETIISNGDSEKWNLLLKIISDIRQEKSKHQKAMNAGITLTLPDEDYKKLEDFLGDLTNVANAEEIKKGKQFKVDFV